jgi:hypothetical protein
MVEDFEYDEHIYQSLRELYERIMKTEAKGEEVQYLHNYLNFIERKIRIHTEGKSMNLRMSGEVMPLPMLDVLNQMTEFENNHVR